MATKGIGIIISTDPGEQEHFSSVLGFLGWRPACAGSMPAALRVFTTGNVDLAFLSENLRGLGLLTALRLLSKVQPHLPVLLVLPEDRRTGFASLPAVGIVSQRATAAEVRPFTEALEQGDLPEAGAAAGRRAGGQPDEASEWGLKAVRLDGSAVTEPEPAGVLA
jgi:hypothetical protein